MKYTLSDTNHFDFFQQLENFLNKAELLQTEFDSNKSVVLLNQIREYLRLHIQQDATPILHILEQYCYHFGLDDSTLEKYGFKKPSDTELDIEELRSICLGLKDVISYLSIIDSLIDPETITSINTITDKNDYILNKLNKLFSDEYYSIAKILALNGVHFRKDEPKEIAQELVRKGYIIQSHSGYDDAKISVKGAAYIERRNRLNKNVNKHTELDKKLDSVVEHLQKLGYGQEIIFNEIEELRGLQSKLPKKSWSQLLKGKLVDLVVDSFINKETANSVYEYLTNTHFKLLG